MSDTGRRKKATSPAATSNPLTSSPADSPAKTLAGQGLALDSKVNVQDSGENSTESFANFDLVTWQLRTSQLCFIEGLQSFSETLPESGTMRNGQLFLRAPWVLHTCDDDCSLWPTPTASMDGRGFGIPLHDRSGRYRKSIISRVHALVGEHGWRIHPRFTEALMGFPTDHSAIAPSETPLSRKSRRSSGK